MKKQGILLVISGPSGSGKGELVKRLIAQRSDIALSVSATTRSPRTGEVNGQSYYFMTREKFKEKLDAGDFLEYNEYSGNFYGTPKSEVMARIDAGTSIILEIDVHGAMNVKRQYPEAVLMMIVPPDFDTLEKRLRGRGDDVPEAVIRTRLENSRYELAKLPCYDYLVINESGKLDATVNEVMSIIDAEQLRVARNPGFAEVFYGECAD